MPERCHRENSKALHPLGNKSGVDKRDEFIKKFGGASAGLDIHAFHNSTLIGKETVIELTQGFRKLLELHEQPMNKLYAISDDGSGNPILMDQQGHIFIYYHDSSEMEILYESLDRLFKETLLSE